MSARYLDTSALHTRRRRGAPRSGPPAGKPLRFLTHFKETPAVRTSHLLSRSLSALFLLCALTLGVSAQTANERAAAPAPQPTPAVMMPQERAAPAVAGRTDLYCAGYVQYAPAPVSPEIVGGEQEQEQRVYAEGDVVFINAGSDQGVRVGQEYQVVRPRGRMSSKFTTKKGYLGVYMLEL